MSNSLRSIQLAVISVIAFGTVHFADAGVLFEDDFTGPLTWSKSDSSVSIRDADYLYIGSDGGYDDWARMDLHVALSETRPIIIEQRTKLVSGGRNYTLPWFRPTFENGNEIMCTSADGPGGWAFTERIRPNGSWSFTGNTQHVPPGENYWAVTKLELTPSGGTLSVKPDDPARGWISSQYHEVATADWSHTSIESLNYQQPWDSVNYVDYVKVSTPSLGSELPQQPQLVPPSGLPDTENLVLYTHGHSDDFTGEVWSDMGQGLSSAVGDDWGVKAYDWTHSNHSGELVGKLRPWDSLDNARNEGLLLGNAIIQKGYDHVHLIAHSAGANLIDTAANVVAQANFLGLTQTEVHTTFLDPFVPSAIEFQAYGSTSDWSENYSAWGDLPLTHAKLPNAHNVDVTLVDPNSGAGGSSHGWPIEFYVDSITNPRPDGYGFRRSLEGGGWDDRGEFVEGDDWVVLGGGAEHFDYTYLSQQHETLQVESLPLAKSDLVQAAGTSIDMRTASPAWISMLIDTTDPVNFVSFDVEFLSEKGAEGLLAAYWNGEAVGTIDERYALDGNNRYTMWLSDIMEPGTHELAFRLDPYTEVQSRAMIDNVRTGLTTVVPEPSSLALLLLGVLSLFGYKMHGKGLRR